MAVVGTMVNVGVGVGGEISTRTPERSPEAMPELARTPATVLAVVHDRYFISGFAMELWVAEEGRIKIGSLP